MLKPIVILVAAASVAFAQTQAPDTPRARALRALAKQPIVDGHNDLPYVIREDTIRPMDVEAYDLRKPTRGHTDFARLKAGKVGAQFWSIYIPGETDDVAYRSKGKVASMPGYARVQLEQIDIARRVVEKYPQQLEWTLNSAAIPGAIARGKIASLLGLEGGHAIENSMSLLRVYYELGARYLTLTHNVTLDWADAALDSVRHGGLTPFGREVVREMNRLGMMVDLSHVSPGSMSDALDVTEAPVIFSHSSARAIVDHARNVPDSILARLPKNGGVVMVTFVPGFISKAVKADDDSVRRRTNPAQAAAWRTAHPRPRATIADVADMIDHVKKVAGVNHVGIGSDYDGISEVPEGLEDVSKFPALFEELAKRGWSEADLVKLAGANVLRALRGAEQVSARLKRERAPSTALIEETDRPIPMSAETRARYEKQLAEARASYLAAPTNADSIIWYARRLGYLGFYGEAIGLYSRGATLQPQNAWMLRHRGHRYISTRQIDLAIADLEKAAALVAGKPDQVEPDGQPNPANTPIGTLHSNIDYHLALAYYLKGDYAKALPIYAREVANAKNEDRRVSMLYWNYLALRRLGKDAEAAALLAPITPQTQVIENGSYRDLLLVFKGTLSADSVLAAAASGGDGTVVFSTMGYGIGAYFQATGRRDHAAQVWRRVVAGGQWPAFGFIAAETDLKRVK
jgi:membrane dipeptidase